MTISEKMSREKVRGFLRAENGKILNGDGEEILLYGMGIGNWLLPEGYMWRFGSPYDRPRTIEGLVRQLCGSAYADYFWKRFRENYITEADVRAMAEAGFNSVRLPVNWRIVMEDEPGVIWKEDGFALIDRFLDWCEKYRLYVCLDLHGAPGGQTGHNIDDSIDDVPRLLTDTESDSREKAIALWQEFARRYRDRWIVGMYDLLNEPVRTGKEGCIDLPDLREELKQFYRDCIAAVREIDQKHMFSLESHFWASRGDFFTEALDPNMCAHFHRYWCQPTKAVYEEFLKVRDELGIALYLGETGENSTEWFAAMYPLAFSLDIGVNVWPWKKMETDSSPCSVRKPKEWEWIQNYLRGGDRPSYARAQRIFDEYLENVKFENCVWVEKVVPSIARRPGCTFRAADALNRNEFVLPTGKSENGGEPKDWADTVMRFTAGGEAEYFLSSDGEAGTFAVTADWGNAAVEIAADGKTLLRTTVSGEREIAVEIPEGRDCILRLTCVKGEFTLDRLEWRK